MFFRPGGSRVIVATAGAVLGTLLMARWVAVAAPAQALVDRPFDPNSASPAELAAHHLPPRPAGAGVDVAGWNLAMASERTFVPPHPTPGTTEEDNGVTQLTSVNWSGYRMYGTYAWTSATWVQPRVDTNPGFPGRTHGGDAPSLSMWTGIGDGVTNPTSHLPVNDPNTIVQTGCESVSADPPAYPCWVEDFPAGVVWVGFDVGPGDGVYAVVSESPPSRGHPTGAASYFIEDETTGAFTQGTIDTLYQTSTDALFVGESNNASAFDVPMYGQTGFFDAVAGGSASGTTSLSTNHQLDAITMYDDGVYGDNLEPESAPTGVVSQPGPIANASASFTLTHRADILYEALSDDPAQGTLNSGQSLLAPSGAFELTMAKDGNLEWSEVGGHLLWATNTGGHPGAHARMDNGDLQVISASGRQLWDSNTSRHFTGYVQPQSDGNLVWYNFLKSPLHSTFTVDSTVASGTVLEPGAARYSPASDGEAFELVMQIDGNLVLYNRVTGVPVASSHSPGHPGAYAMMQPDGNFVVLYGHTVLFSSRTAGHPGAFLSLSPGGSLKVVSPSGQPLTSLH